LGKPYLQIPIDQVHSGYYPVSTFYIGIGRPGFCKRIIRSLWLILGFGIGYILRREYCHLQAKLSYDFKADKKDRKRVYS
jgi:hypothetical protein